MKHQTFAVRAALLECAALIVLSLSGGCSTADKKGETYQPRVKWFAHCDTCNWCRGSYKRAEEAQQVVSEHNMKLHDWIRVAYYDQNNCRK
ncbi:MAG TPA: hypothetical protein VK633_07025 [Verrucomicrobiae bacterium]|nr:hypothetical protein [Verrucomicrobiae bacterium]